MVQYGKLFITSLVTYVLHGILLIQLIFQNASKFESIKCLFSVFKTAAITNNDDKAAHYKLLNHNSTPQNTSTIRLKILTQAMMLC